jgi:alkylation response protein AidB-like acyl-CoA dehydrogenase
MKLDKLNAKTIHAAAALSGLGTGSAVADNPLLHAIRDLLGEPGSATQAPAELLCRLVDAGLDRLPLPGGGATMARWRVLAAVAAHNLSLAKLYEAHTDALAILAEAGFDEVPRYSIWGVWCAESPGTQLSARRTAADTAGGSVMLNGEKHWCSGASAATHALLSCRDEQKRPCLAAVDLAQDGIDIVEDEWHAVGMAGTRTARLRLTRVAARMVGGPHFYTGRPGFWQGGAGIAACWFGAAQALADTARQWLTERNDAHGLAHLGQIEVALCAAALALRHAAQWIDAEPASDAARVALRLRLTVEQAARETMEHAGRALGPAIYCGDRRSARLLADLPVFLRQSHAERDLAALGEMCTESGETPWQW